MEAENWRQIKEVFNQAVELDAALRADFLHSFVDENLRREVEKLLAADAEAKTLPDVLASAEIISLPDAVPAFAGRRIGNYKILRQLGAGGMGAVFLATREDLKKQVALKIVKHEFSAMSLLNRFQNEREILAALEHPNIAHLLDSGTTSDGLPYFVMEYVEGDDLLTFCRRRNLSVNEKLKLFRKVCEAVAYAHSRLVVHRDLKPSNILVTKTGEPKLLDFGISKLISENESNEKGTITSFGILTPNYASPEQFRGETVSTSTDVYSLGVILYELLTDALPYEVINKRFDEVARAVIETEPARPSAVIWDLGFRISDLRRTASGGEQTDGSKAKTNPKSQIPNPKSLRGDLDNICLKALRKEPPKRYASVEQFGGDISRHLEGLPVIARADTFSYRFEKFVWRHRASVVAGVLIFLSLIAGIAATGWQAYRAEQHRTMTEKRFNQVRELANNIVFKYYDEAEKLPNSTALREMFVKDSLRYLDSLAADETDDRELRIELGKAFLRIAKVQGRPNSPNLGETAGALENYRKGIEILEPLALNSKDANLQGEMISAYTDYAVVLKQNGNFPAATEIFRQSIRAGEVFYRQNPDDANLASRLALGIMFWGDSLPLGTGENENIHVYKKALAAYEGILKRSPDDLRINASAVATGERAALAFVTLAKSARFGADPDLVKRYLQEAEPLLERNVRIGERMVELYPNQILPPAMLAAAQISYGTLLIEREDYARALEMLRKGERFYRASLENDPISVGQKIEVSVVEQKLAAIYSRTGKNAEADALYAHAVERLDFLVEIDAENFDYVKIRGEAKFDYADELLRRGETARARQIYESAFREMLPASEKKDSAFAASLHGLFYEKLGNCWLAGAGQDKSRIEKAILEYEKTLEIWKTNPVLNIAGIRQDDKLGVLERKIDRLKTT